jgi:hypothetical protein
VEVGLLNVALDVWIKATDIDNATQTFVIPASGISSQKKVLLDVLQVKKLVGATAISHIGLCIDQSSTPSPISKNTP